jgi:two-component system OmpR family sensor kinase
MLRVKSIQTQLIAWLFLSIVLAGTAAGVASYFSSLKAANNLFDYLLQQAALSLPAHPEANMPTQNEPFATEHIVVQVWNPEDELIYTSNTDWTLPRYKQQGFHTVEAFDTQWRIYTENRRSNFIQLAQPLDSRNGLARNLAVQALIPFAVLIPVMLLLVIVSIQRGLLPLRGIAQALYKRTPNDLQPLQLASMPRELMIISRALNNLLARLDKALNAQRAFVADAAHELRSPLTALKLQLQLAERTTQEPQRTQAISKLHERLNRAIALVEQMLTLARQEASVELDAYTPINLRDLILAVVQQLQPQAEVKQIHFNTDLIANAGIKGHRANLEILLRNLLDNALKHTPAQGTVHIGLQTISDKIQLDIIDNGSGIAEQERERVFARFYRGVDEQVPGTGLGLAIVKNIAEQHQASIELLDNPQGTGVWVKLIFMLPP